MMNDNPMASAAKVAFVSATYGTAEAYPSNIRAAAQPLEAPFYIPCNILQTTKAAFILRRLRREKPRPERLTSQTDFYAF